MQSLAASISHIDREIKGILRSLPIDQMADTERKNLQHIRLSCNEARLDVRDYEFAETRDKQIVAAEKAKRNIRKLEAQIIVLSDIFGPADIAQLSAELQMVYTRLQ